jgi:hypothetical protein
MVRCQVREVDRGAGRRGFIRASDRASGLPTAPNPAGFLWTRERGRNPIGYSGELREVPDAEVILHRGNPG